MKIFVGSSSSSKIPISYTKDCEMYLNEILANHDLVFGTYSEGLMKVSYDIAKKNNNKVTGICPEIYSDDLKMLDCEEEVITPTVSSRTEYLIEYSDALIFLPGGVGTLTELFTAIDKKRNNEFDKPIIVFNSNNFFEPILSMFEKIYNEKFSPVSTKNCYLVTTSAIETLEYIEKYKKEKRERC